MLFASNPPHESTPRSLPSGYTSQPAWRFRDRTGQFSYEFNRVYGSPIRCDGREPVCRLDQDLSYWCVVGQDSVATTGANSSLRALNYAEARKMSATRLTFEEFASPLRMQAELEAEEVSQPPRRVPMFVRALCPNVERAGFAIS